MIWGSLLLAISYITALMFLARGKRRYLALILLLFFATFGAGELLLLSYSFLLVLCVLKQINSDDLKKTAAFNWRLVLPVVLMWSTLGLLPVVKGSLLLPFAVSVAISSGLLAFRARFRQALFLLFIPVAASLTFWVLAGQSLAVLPAFLRGTLSLTSGYTEAMSTSWAVLPEIVGDGFVIVYLAIAAAICLSVVRCTRFTVASRWMLALLYAVFLLVTFKHGFVAVAGVSSVYASLAVYILIICLLYIDRYLIWSLCIVIVITTATSIINDTVLVKEVHERFGVGAAWGEVGKRGDILAFCTERALGAYPRTTYKRAWNTYSEAWEGFLSRASRADDLGSRYVKAEAIIRGDYPVPALKGTADIYNQEQSALLASNNEWDPRPVVQSYSAYTPDLARLDEQHLRGQDVPDWVLFDLQTIDGRLPSLDDGLSWPALLDNYAFDSYNGRFVLLRKNVSIHSESSYDDVQKHTYETGATVRLPETDGLVFAEVDLKPTLAGRVLIALFSPPQLHIVLGLGNGSKKTYRVVSPMMKTDFLLSPLISTTEEFASLTARSTSRSAGDNVETMSIVPAYGGSLFWSSTYELTLKRYVGE
jgi:hypothetical protein